MFQFLIFLFVLSVLILVHELGHFLAARRVGVRVEKFSLGFGPVLWEKKRGDTVYCLSVIPLGGFVKLSGDNLEEFKGRAYEYYSKSVGERAQIICAGSVFNYVLAFLLFWIIFFTGYPMLTARVGGFVDEFPAKGSGLLVGDRVLSVDGAKVVYFDDLQRIISDKKEGNTVLLRVSRQGKETEVPVKVKEKEFEDVLGQKRSVGLLGITPFDEVVTVRHGIFKAFALGLNKTWDLTTLTYQGLWMMLTGKISLRKSVAGPLGIFDITAKAARRGAVMLFGFMAVLSLSLAIFNMLPLPVMDGGHIVLLGLEKIRKKALSIRADRIITRIGVTLLVFLALLVTYNDVMRLFGDKITKLINR